MGQGKQKTHLPTGQWISIFYSCPVTLCWNRRGLLLRQSNSSCTHTHINFQLVQSIILLMLMQTNTSVTSLIYKTSVLSHSVSMFFPHSWMCSPIWRTLQLVLTGTSIPCSKNTVFHQCLYIKLHQTSVKQDSIQRTVVVVVVIAG